MNTQSNNVILTLIYVVFFCSAPHNLDKRTTITIDDKTFVVEADDLEKISDLGGYSLFEMFIFRIKMINESLCFYCRTWRLWNCRKNATSANEYSHGC